MPDRLTIERRHPPGSCKTCGHPPGDHYDGRGHCDAAGGCECVAFVQEGAAVEKKPAKPKKPRAPKEAGEAPMNGWTGVDLDGVLAYWDEAHFPDIGPPIAPMVERVQGWLAEGKDVRIFTARVARTADETYEPYHLNAEEFRRDQEHRIQAWCQQHLGRVLPVTAIKDFQMVELWDDRCVQMETNTGRPMVEVLAGLTLEVLREPTTP